MRSYLAFPPIAASPLLTAGDTGVEAVLSLGAGRIVVLAGGALVMLDTPPAN